MTLWLVLVLVTASSSPCDDLSSTRQLLERARAFELNHLENAHGTTLLEGLVQCRIALAPTRCEAQRHHEFRQAVETSRTSVADKYRRLLEEAETRCHAPLA